MIITVCEAGCGKTCDGLSKEIQPLQINLFVDPEKEAAKMCIFLCQACRSRTVEEITQLFRPSKFSVRILKEAEA